MYHIDNTLAGYHFAVVILLGGPFVMYQLLKKEVFLIRNYFYIALFLCLSLFLCKVLCINFPNTPILPMLLEPLYYCLLFLPCAGGLFMISLLLENNRMLLQSSKRPMVTLIAAKIVVTGILALIIVLLCYLAYNFQLPNNLFDFFSRHKHSLCNLGFIFDVLFSMICFDAAILLLYAIYHSLKNKQHTFLLWTCIAGACYGIAALYLFLFHLCDWFKLSFLLFKYLQEQTATFEQAEQYFVIILKTSEIIYISLIATLFYTLGLKLLEKKTEL
ncbi:MAG: hypothetical protein RLZ12_773 [Bacillota bacterium]|jgi:hypothetical protein